MGVGGVGDGVGVGGVGNGVGVGLASHFKGFLTKFLCDGQGTFERATLSVDRSGIVLSKQGNRT